jgi:hypothetical protein
METVGTELGRPGASVGESDAASIPGTRRWLTHELCKARARRPSSWSWPARSLLDHSAGSWAREIWRGRCVHTSEVHASRAPHRMSFREPQILAQCADDCGRNLR